jgi:dihydrofolate synthase/folylpolyglutamate synthase
LKKRPAILKPKGHDVSALLDRLYGYTDYARRRNAPYTPAVYDPRGMTRLLSALGNPQNSFQVVHLAGTKGKGSTATYLARLLMAAGHRTGLTTSPQVFDERDRIAVGGQIISWGDFGRLFEICERTAKKKGLKPTVFEFFTAMALLYFKEKQVAWAVVETGLGGRLDSTNVLEPRLTAITAIAADNKPFI